MRPRRIGRPVAFTAASAFLMVLLIVQMWLLTAALESSLAGHDEVTLPAFVVSLVLAMTGGAVYLFASRRDGAVDRTEAPSREGPWMIR